MTSEQRMNLMREKLNLALNPTHLEIIDESHLHIGHVGAQSGGGHYKLIISSPLFNGQNQIARHRLIYSSLGDLMKHEIHALTIEITH